MKIVHIGGGLGNQMADYFNYLTIKKSNPTDDVYIETLTYNIDEAGLVVRNWNGYELERVFGLKLPNILDLFTAEEQKQIVKDLHDTRYWEGEWKPRLAVLQTLEKHGITCKMAGNIENVSDSKGSKAKRKIRAWMTEESNSRIEYEIKKLLWKISHNIKKKDDAGEILGYRDGNWYYAPTFSGIKSERFVAEIGPLFRESLKFPEIIDDKNIAMQELIVNNNVVSIHARRSDYLKYNNDCYKFGYFKKAVKYMKSVIENPIFVVFSEESDWCKENRNELGLTNNDVVHFVDWNLGYDSFRDLQLMSQCRGNIITKSSFGYLACLLNKNENKITCSQMSEYLTTKHI